MSHPAGFEQFDEWSALYALGALGQQEARIFEAHLAAGCALCAARLNDDEAIVALLGFGAPAETPDPRLRDRLLERINGRSHGETGVLRAIEPLAFYSLRAGEGEWEEVKPGVLVKPLAVDEAHGVATSLVRMMPGTRLGCHRHEGVEQLYILEGDCHIQDLQLGPGDFHFAAAGSIHESTYTVNGTMFLLVAPMAYEFYD